MHSATQPVLQLAACETRPQCCDVVVSMAFSHLKQCSGKSTTEPEGEPAKPSVNLEEIRAEIRAEIKAKIEEEAYNKG